MDKLKNIAGKITKAITNNTKPIKLITHTDMDGAGAAVVMNIAADILGRSIDITHVDNKDMNAAIKTAAEDTRYSIVIVTDLSCDEKTAEHINNISHDNIIILDHHKTSDHLNKYDWAVSRSEALSDDRSSSGTSLIFETLKIIIPGFRNHKLLEKFVYTVADYDTWKWTTDPQRFKDCPDLNTLYWFYGTKHFEEKYTHAITYGSNLFTSQDRVMLAIEDEKAQAAAKKAAETAQTAKIIVNRKEYSIVYTYAARYMPAVINEIKTQFPDKDLMILIANSSLSLRSINPDTDVSAIAEFCGGGGHKNAAGISIDNKLTLNFITNILSTQIIK